MTWWFWILIFVCDLFCAFVGWRCGARSERIKQASREEAIRKAAYGNGCEWSLNFWRGHMNKTEWNELYQGHFDTKEGS